MAKVAMIWDGGSDFGRVVVGIGVELLNLKSHVGNNTKGKTKEKMVVVRGSSDMFISAC